MLTQLFDLSGLAPHGTCLLWRPDIFWALAGSDVAIAIAYLSISSALLVFINRRRDLYLRWVGALFAAFILLCAASHVTDVWTLWFPDYGIQVMIKFGTAAISVGTAVLLWLMMPTALALPSAQQMADANASLLAAKGELRRAHEDLERKVEQRTRELSERTAQLEESNQELERFAYVASHDMREPLRMISSYLSLIERRLPDASDEIKEFMGFAKDGAKRLDTQILDLLQYSRIGREGDAMAPVALGEAMAKAVANLAVSIEEQAATVAIVTDPPTVLGHDGELVRLFQNLIGNALKYCAPGQSPKVSVSTERQNDFWRISVADNGIGIAAEYHERIFEIFQRLHGGSDYQGTGIGLAICRKIVQRHGGRIWVESAPGEGAVFHFTLPVPASI